MMCTSVVMICDCMLLYGMVEVVLATTLPLSKWGMVVMAVRDNLPPDGRSRSSELPTHSSNLRFRVTFRLELKFVRIREQHVLKQERSGFSQDHISVLLKFIRNVVVPKRSMLSRCT